MIVGSSLEALTQTPLRFVRSAWPWRSLGYLLASVVPGLCAVGLAALFDATPDAVAFGLFAVALLALVTPLITWFERWRMRLVDSTPITRPPRAPLLVRMRRPDIWREFAHALVVTIALSWIDLGMVALSLGIPGGLMTAPWQPDQVDPLSSAVFVIAGLFLVPVAAYPITAWAGARAAMSRAILAPDDSQQVRRSRARLVDAFEVERRRIERDLHDGAQQRLVALSMKLGLAKLGLPPGSPALHEVEEAHEQATLALAELRELIRGVHPQVLSGRGLAAAIRDVAGRSPVPIHLDLRLPDRLSQAVEVNAYYVVAEALANIAKHSRATQARVETRLVRGMLHLSITDDGIGGALADRGSGLTGLADRVATLDGRVYLSSPSGGPTTIRVEVPCSG